MALTKRKAKRAAAKAGKSIKRSAKKAGKATVKASKKAIKVTKAKAKRVAKATKKDRAHLVAHLQQAASDVKDVVVDATKA